MWFIKHATSGEKFYFSADKNTYTVGRVGTDLELQNDNCVSRSHAIFHVTETQGELHIELEDMGSKYGTFYNKDIEKNIPLEKGHKVVLKNNDIIRFGRLQNVWKVQHVNYVTITSALTKNDVLEVTKNITSIGGKVLERWSNLCTHLTMNEPSVTVKLLFALIEQKQIVKSNYWADLSKAVGAKNPQLPNPEMYRPSFGEENIDVGCKPERRNLFNGLTFVFLCRKHSDTYTPIVKAAGGVCKEITSGIQKAFLIKNNVVVIQYIPSTPTQSSQTINEIADILQAHSKRIIPEYEIGLAIMHCSTQEFCNPQQKVTETMPQTATNTYDNSMSVDLSEQINTKSLDFDVAGANPNLITSTPYDDVLPSHIYDKEDYQETMPNMRITETPLDQPKKRKHSNALENDLQGSDEEDLFQFSKKSCNRNELEANAAGDAQKDGASISKERTMKRSMFSEYSDKEQPANKTARSSSHPREGEEPTTSHNRKRPHIQVMGEDDGGEDDLFSFGDTQNNKKRRSEANDNEDDNDLFAFKDNKNKEQSDDQSAQDEDSVDVMPTQKFVVVAKPKKSNTSIQMPKPKILPRKISAIDWISGSLGKIKIKNENSATSVNNIGEVVKEECGREFEIKTEPNGGEEFNVKTEVNGDELNMTDDHRKWLESLKDAIEIQEVSLRTTTKLNERSHYKCKNNQLLNGTITNFKPFVKKYKTPTETNSIQLHLR